MEKLILRNEEVGIIAYHCLGRNPRFEIKKSQLNTVNLPYKYDLNNINEIYMSFSCFAQNFVLQK